MKTPIQCVWSHSIQNWRSTVGCRGCARNVDGGPSSTLHACATVSRACEPREGVAVLQRYVGGPMLVAGTEDGVQAKEIGHADGM